MEPFTKLNAFKVSNPFPTASRKPAMTISQKGQLPDFLKDMIACPPRHGDGVHQWLFRVARQLHAHRDEDDIHALLAAATSDCGRTVSESEIRNAIENSRATAWKPSGTGARPQARPRPKWPEVNAKKIERLERENPFALLQLERLSPVKISLENHDPECILERLFPGNPLLCVAKGVSKAIVAPRKSLPSLEGGFSHIVPSPMSKPEGTNQQGKPSVRCLDNTGRRAYLVTEFDQGSPERQSAVILHLSLFAPLVMVVDSAGKSFHAWFHCANLDEAEIRKFFSYAVSLGADPATWTRCQLVRMPLGWRPEKDKTQEVVFFEYRNAAAVMEGGSHE